ncbi:MAG TPA: HmuY family protein [Bacteroidia bacterium]|nr:HmuY family protein [Bacteroidia bacterium]HNT79340.1 HmuY family protein [Bacteroidia bacterium]
MRSWILFIALGLFFSSCEKNETALSLNAPGNLTLMQASMGNTYQSLVFVDLYENKTYSAPYNSFDLAFEASAQGNRVYLNQAKFMFAGRSGYALMNMADSTGVNWKTDHEHLYDDSLAMSSYYQNSIFSGEVFIIDRGAYEHSGAERFRKFKVDTVDANGYQISYSYLDNSGYQTFFIPKNNAYALMYFNFSGGGQLVSVAPPSSKWQLMFGKYIHEYKEEPIGSPFRYYLVTGTLLNRWNQIEAGMLAKDSLPDYIPFADLEFGQAQMVQRYTQAAYIGFEWKQFSFSTNLYSIVPDRYYIIKDATGYLYKLRFLDFYDTSGNKGTAIFEYKRF